MEWTHMATNRKLFSFAMGYILIGRCISLENLTRNETSGTADDCFGSTAADKISESMTRIYFDGNFEFGGINIECANDVRFSHDALVSLTKCNDEHCRQTHEWINHVLDSQGRRLAGVLWGNKFWLGGFWQCLSIERRNVNDSGRFFGKHCKVLAPDKQLQHVMLGVCVPSTCSNVDVHKMLTHSTGIKNISIFCHEQNEIARDISSLLALTVFSCFILVLVIATIVDIVLFCDHGRYVDAASIEGALLSGQHQEKVQTHYTKLLLSFSLLSNGVKLFSTSEPAGQLSCLHGIRSLSMIWIVFIHIIIPQFGADNPVYIREQLIKPIPFAALRHNNLAVENFFVLSGLLVSYTWHKSITGNVCQIKNPCYWLKFFIRRYVRLYLPAAVLLYFYLTSYYFLSDGVFWPNKNLIKGSTYRELLHMHNDCSEWWHNLLFINNYTGGKCMQGMWYLASDFQLFLLSPIILVPLIKSPKFANVLILALLITHVVSRAAIFSLNDYSPNCIPAISENYKGDISSCVYGIYYQTQYRYGPYLVGLLTGHLLSKKENHPRLSQAFNVVAWSIAVASFVVVPSLPFVVTHMNAFLNGIFSGGSRLLWSISLAWMIYNCLTANAVMLNKFLSWRLWRPVSRISYSAYLVHTLAYRFIVDISERPAHFDSNITAVLEFFKALVITLIVAVVLTLAVEMPTMEIEKVLAGKIQKKTK